MLGVFEDWKPPEGKKIVLIGSCFSDNLKPLLEKEEYEVSSNLFGTLFHPIPIFNWLKCACTKTISDEEMQLVYHEEIWKSLGGGKVLRADSRSELRNLIQYKLNILHEKLKSANTLVVTLGTAHAWIHEDMGLVGNCQRLPQQVFKQELVPLSQMVRAGNEVIQFLQKLNPELSIVWNVSPVKHWRMGVVANVRSKSRCIELAHELCNRVKSVYFPSYEFVTDVLRNDLYFEDDRCHPNEQAISLVSQYFRGAGKESEENIEKTTGS